MRTSRLVCFAAVALVACGGDSSSSADGGSDGSTDGTMGTDGNPVDSGNKDGASGSDAGSDTGSNTDGAPPGSITCGTTSCPTPTEACCIDPGPPVVSVCTGGDAGMCMAGMVAMKCRSAADCPSNDVCCLDETVDPGVATCTTTCSGMNRARLCDPTASDALNKCGDAGACGVTNNGSWNLPDTAPGTCGDPTGPN